MRHSIFLLLAFGIHLSAMEENSINSNEYSQNRHMAPVNFPSQSQNPSLIPLMTMIANMPTAVQKNIFTNKKLNNKSHYSQLYNHSVFKFSKKQKRPQNQSVFSKKSRVREKNSSKK